MAFAELLGRPDVVEDLQLRSGVGFLALHGGLEPGTAELARRAAAQLGASWYTVTQPRELRLHVPSVDADPGDAPRLAAFLEHVHTVISLHGYYRPLERPQAVLIGGATRPLVGALADELRLRLPHYRIVDDVAKIPTHMRGRDARNPVNRTRRGGVQLELPHHLRTVGMPRVDARRARHAADTAVLVDAVVGFARRLGS